MLNKNKNQQSVLSRKMIRMAKKEVIETERMGYQELTGAPIQCHI
jgi:hypothetical protein